MRKKNVTSMTKQAGKAAPSPREHMSPTADEANQVSAGSRQQMIAEAAYYRAESRGFAPGGELADWLQAEANICRLVPQ